MNELKQKYYNACKDVAKQNTYDVNRLTQAQFNEALEQTLKSAWVFIEKNCQPKQVKVEPEVILQKTGRKKMQPHIKELIIKILFDYYEHGVHTHAIMPASDAQIILNEVVRMIDEKITDWKEHAFKSGGVALQELKESFLSE